MTTPYPSDSLYPADDLYPGAAVYPGGTTGGVAVTATPDPSALPPRVRVDVADTRATPASSVTVTATGPDGRTWPLRTADGDTLALSGGVGTVWTSEVPFGLPVTYSTDVAGSGTAVATLDADRPWLIHPGIPARSQPLAFRAGTNDSEDWDIDQGAFTVLGRSTPVIFTGGARTATASTLIVELSTDTDRAALRLLLSDGSTLYLNVPPSLGVGLSSDYVAIGKVTPARRPGASGFDTARDVTLPYQVVARPAGGTQSDITWKTVEAKYASWLEVEAAVSSWAELAAPTG